MSGEFSGALRERVTIERRLPTRDARAGAVRGYAYDGAAWAGVTPIIPSTLEAADSHRARPRWQVTMRKREGIDLMTRLVWRGRFLAVRSVGFDPRDPTRFQINCEEIV